MRGDGNPRARHTMPESPGKGRSLLERLTVAATLICILTFFGIRLCLIFNRTFNQDEFQYLHHGWMIGQGYVPYRDFWNNHTPLLWLALAPFAIVFDEHPAYLFAGRILILLVAVGVGVMVYRLTRLFCSVYGALFSIFLLSIEFYTLDKGIEVRPDQVMVLTWLIAAWILIRSRSRMTMRGVAPAGLILGVGLLFTPKASFAIFSLGAGLLALAILPGREAPISRPQILKALGAMGAMSLVPLLVTTLALLPVGAAGPLFEQALIGNVGFKRASGLALTFFKASVILTPVFWACAAVGLFLIVRRVIRPQSGQDRRALVIILASIAGAGIAYFTLIPAPYKQSLLPLLILVAPAGGTVGDRLFDSLGRRHRPALRWAAGLAFVVIFLLGAGRAFAGMSVSLHPLTPTNAEQIERMRYVLKLTSKTDSVLDGLAAYIFRPQGSFYASLVDELLHRFRTGTPSYDIPERCRTGGCRVAILDFRMRQMPREVLQFIHDHYSPTAMKDVLVRRQAENSLDAGRRVM